ncbi:DUF3137 domain-containing protein [Litoribacillus peritrichatus]|uniref:DUF3137 domain-containing protein n=1 Tax=Litoribacillus peritrichatus TaxID=718191 RepID=A0ABP7MBH4_9GAMM
MDTLLNNDFKTVSFNPDEKIKDLLAKFKEFHRGNDAKEIQHLYKREYQGAVHTFAFEMYRFHYVRKTTESYTDSNGNRRTRTRRVSYYRHGILMNFPFAKSLCINSDSEISHKGEKYTTASNQFNRRFKVRTKDELQTARFLTPAVIELLTQMDQLLKNLNIEITGQNELCLSFDDDNLLKAKQVNDLSNPEAFAKEIAQHAELKTLDTLLEHIHDLMRLSDNNFI